MNWLFKEEPTHYSFANLQKDGRTVAKAMYIEPDHPVHQRIVLDDGRI